MENRELEIAWKFIENTDVNIFLTGKAGSGKTTFLRKLCEELPKRKIVVAPTGVAAINAGGVTIHSFFQLPLGVHIPGMTTKDRSRTYSMSKTKKNILRTLDLLIIDEISMVRCDLLDAVDSELRKYRDRTKPFGGVQLLMIGDLQQLAPVSVDKEWEALQPYYETPYFFSSKALSQSEFLTIELKHIYRQSDSRFIDLLGKVRDGILDSRTVNALNSRYIPGFVPPAASDYILLTTHNYRANQYNQKMLSVLPGQSHMFTCKIEDTFPETLYPADAVLELKVGAQVMFIKNDPNGLYYNGKIGKVTGFDGDFIFVGCKGESSPIKIGMSSWENSEYEINTESKEITEVVVGRFYQYPLRHAWAITIHKSQGLTFEHAILDVNYSFAHGQVYVAMSRCRSLEGMVLSSPLSVQSLKNDENVSQFINSELSNAESNYSQYDHYRSRYNLRLLDEQFGFDKLMLHASDMSRLYNEHFYRGEPEKCQSWNEACKALSQLVEVARKFRSQYQRILSSNGTTFEDSHLQERIHKASDYFLEILLAKLLPLTLNSKIAPTQNKQLIKRYDNSYDRLFLELQIKVYTLKGLSEHDFSGQAYLHDKAMSLLSDEERSKKSSKSRLKKSSPVIDVVAVPKRKKGDTLLATLSLFESGMDCKSIAIERNLAVSTVFGHLMKLVDAGKLRFEDCIPSSHIDFVADYLEGNGMPEQDELKKIIPDDFNYGEFFRIAEYLGYKRD